MSIVPTNKRRMRFDNLFFSRTSIQDVIEEKIMMSPILMIDTTSEFLNADKKFILSIAAA